MEETKTSELAKAVSNAPAKPKSKRKIESKTDIDKSGSGPPTISFETKNLGRIATGASANRGSNHRGGDVKPPRRTESFSGKKEAPGTGQQMRLKKPDAENRSQKSG